MMKVMKTAVLTDFDANQFDVVEECASRKGVPLATWVGQAVTIALGGKGTPLPEKEPRTPKEPHDGKNQVRIRIKDYFANKLLIMSEDLGGTIGVSTLVREIALAAADDDSDLGVSSRLWKIVSAARRRTAALR